MSKEISTMIKEKESEAKLVADKKAKDIIKRHLHKLTQETQNNWFKVLSIALMMA